MDDVEIGTVIATRIVRESLTKMDELEDKLKTLSMEDDLTNERYQLTDYQSISDQILPDERDSPDFFHIKTPEPCVISKSSSVDEGGEAVEFAEVKEDLIEPSQKHPIESTRKQLDVFVDSDQYPAYDQDDCQEHEEEAGHELEGHDATTIEEEQMEGRISEDTSQQIFISHMIEAANRSEASTGDAADDVRVISDSTLGGIALGFDDEELREGERSTRGGLPFGILDPKSPELTPGSYSYISDLHLGSTSEKTDDESVLTFSSKLNNDGRGTMGSPRCLVESPPDLLSPSREIALKDELSPVTENPIICRKKMAIGSSPSGFILEEDEEEEELQLTEAQRGFFRPITSTISSDQTDSEAEECNQDKESDDRRIDSECESETEKFATERGDDGEEEKDSDEATSPFDVITNDDLDGYVDYGNELSDQRVVDTSTSCAQDAGDSSNSVQEEDMHDEYDDGTAKVN